MVYSTSRSRSPQLKPIVKPEAMVDFHKMLDEGKILAIDDHFMHNTLVVYTRMAPAGCRIQAQVMDKGRFPRDGNCPMPWN
jgi:hypothetical protein